MTGVAVVGAGLMGAGIAQVAAQAGWDVVLHDVAPAALDRAMRAMRESTARLVAKQLLDETSRERALGLVRPTSDLHDVTSATLVVEAVVEDLDVKRAVFARLDELCPEDTVLASNTSAIPITRLAAATRRAHAVIGMHFFSPVPVMQLCELVRARQTSDATLERARAAAESFGKSCIVVNRDVAGFVTTRLISALILEAVRLRESGIATAEDIDLACRLGFGHAMGPLATADLTGIDVLRRAALAIYAETGAARFFPPELMSQMVTAGELGRKSGQGFFAYAED